MPIYETHQPQRTGEEAAVRLIRTRFAQALGALNRAIQDTNNAVARHGRGALADVITAEGDSPAEMVSVFNALAEAKANITGETQVPLDDTQ